MEYPENVKRTEMPEYFLEQLAEVTNLGALVYGEILNDTDLGLFLAYDEDSYVSVLDLVHLATVCGVSLEDVVVEGGADGGDLEIIVTHNAGDQVPFVRQVLAQMVADATGEAEVSPVKRSVGN